MRSPLRSLLAVAALAALLPTLAFAQRAVEAPYSFLEAIATADLDALSTALAAAPELAESLDPSGSSAVFMAFDSPDPSGVLDVFLKAGLSPFHEDEDNDRDLMSQAVWYGDAEAAGTIAQAMKRSSPDKWTPVLGQALKLMDGYEKMTAVRMEALAMQAMARGADKDYVLKRLAIMAEGRTRYPEVRRVLASILSYPIVLIVNGAGGLGPLFIPNDTDLEPALAASFGAAASVLFPMGEITQGIGGATVPFWSAGLYAAGRAALSDSLSMYAVTGGLELDMIHFLFMRVGGGYAFSSKESMSFTYDGYGGPDSLEVTLPGAVMDIALGMRFFVGSFMVSFECPITLRLFEKLSTTEHPVYGKILGGSLERNFNSIGIMLGLGYRF